VVSAAIGRREAPRSGMSIGEVMEALRPDFPDVTISKIRFLEEKGLVQPGRTPSGYRKFSSDDLDRLRYVLSVQRDHYLPLRVIREHLRAWDTGVEPTPVGHPARLPRLVPDRSGGTSTSLGSGHSVLLTREDLLSATGVDPALLASLESFGLVGPLPGGQEYDVESLSVIRAASALAEYGIEPRHLRAFRIAAEREADLAEQVAAPMRRQRGSEASARADEVVGEVAGLCLQLHSALVRTALAHGDH
jgi:DNA-binding transcriptional MerR regulator